MQLSDNQEKKSRLGFNYLSDTYHFGIPDAHLWAAELKKLGAHWILLQAPLQRAIPESFLTPLIHAGIQPVLQFSIPTDDLKSVEGYRILFNHYARQGVRYAIFFDRPNMQQNWVTSVWAQEDLVERFLDQFLPLAEMALYEGLVPVFPALEPGGDYWDLAFLRAALKSIQRRGGHRILDVMALAVYARAGNRPLDWGSGGLDRWPGLRPYQNQPGMQDHCGFRTFDWYLDICSQELGRGLPLILLQSGSRLEDQQDPQFPVVDRQTWSDRNISIIRWLHQSSDGGYLSGKAPEEIVVSFFDLMEVANGKLKISTEEKIFQTQQPFVNMVRSWAASYLGQVINITERDVTNEARLTKPDSKTAEVAARAVSVRYFDPETPKNGQEKGEDAQSISHYVLLPLYAWGAAEWDMELITPLIQENHPTVGFSLTEAGLADRVTVVGGKETFTEQALETLRRAGCVVERMLPDGTLVATY